MGLPRLHALGGKLGLETRFVGGQRYTDEAMLKAVVMTLAGTVNKEVAGLINRAGGNAVGLSGIDNDLLQAVRYAPKGHDLGLVGTVEHVNAAFLNKLLDADVMPVIAPVGVSAEGEVYNINADVAASAIAEALGAEKLFFLSDTEGVLVDGELVPTLTNARAQQLIRSGVISGGMIPKVTAAFEALANGVKKVHLINGSTKHSLLLEIFTHEGVGTQTEMLDAELALTQAKTKLVQALRDYAVANASLDKATARIVPPAESPDAKK